MHKSNKERKRKRWQEEEEGGGHRRQMDSLSLDVNDYTKAGNAIDYASDSYLTSGFIWDEEERDGSRRRPKIEDRGKNLTQCNIFTDPLFMDITSDCGWRCYSGIKMHRHYSVMTRRIRGQTRVCVRCESGGGRTEGRRRPGCCVMCGR